MRNRWAKYLGVISVFIASLIGSLLGQESVSIGVTPGPHLEIMEFVKKQAAAQGLTLKIVEFNDFIMPNVALNDGDLDMNAYQHAPFLEDQVKHRGYKLTEIGKNILLPMGIYSRKIDCLDQLKEKAKVAIPNDPTNGGRALLLLQEKGLIQLKKDVGYAPTPLDILKNPKKLKIIELEAPQIPRALADVDIAVINTDWALIAGMQVDQAIAMESTDSPYANIFVVRTADKDNPKLQRVVHIYQTQETVDFIHKRFGDAILPAWEAAAKQ